MLTWYAQEHPTSCIAACVRMVLTDFHEHRTEAQIRELLGRPRLGITLSVAQARLVQVGARAALHHDWSLDDLREALRQTEGDKSADEISRMGALMMRHQS